MTVAVWPETLPLPQRQGFQYTKGEARRQSQPDSGPPRVSRRFSRTADPVQMVLDCDRDELLIFDTFFDRDTAKGARPFRMKDVIRTDLPLLDHLGQPLETNAGAPLLIASVWLCLFGQQLPAITTYGKRWRISFEIWVMP
ncbi:MAG: hypothetical protein AAF739_03150 [Pseudomonadota bacterium]